MLDEYLKNLNLNFKNIVLDICNNNNDFKLFLINCSKIKLKIFESDKVDEKEVINKKIKNLKQFLIKKFGMRIFKKFSIDEYSIIDIEQYFNKLKYKIIILDDILNFLSKYSELEFLNIFSKNEKNFKINYSIKPIEVLEFDESLFITSDELDENKNNIILYDIKSNDKYLHEYSN